MPLWQPMQLVRNKRADAAGAAGHVLADAIRRPRRIHDARQVIAQMIHHREAEHRPIRPVDEEGARGAARGHHAGGGRRRNSGERGLGARHQMRLQIDVVGVHRLIHGVVGRRVRGNAGRRIGDVHEVGAQQRVERNVIAHHSDHRRRVIVERHEHRLIAIRPRRRQVADRVVVERGILWSRSARR